MLTSNDSVIDSHWIVIPTYSLAVLDTNLKRRFTDLLRNNDKNKRSESGKKINFILYHHVKKVLSRLTSDLEPNFKVLKTTCNGTFSLLSASLKLKDIKIIALHRLNDAMCSDILRPGNKKKENKTTRKIAKNEIR